jgi:hypothetical protein
VSPRWGYFCGFSPSSHGAVQLTLYFPKNKEATSCGGFTFLPVACPSFVDISEPRARWAR